MNIKNINQAKLYHNDLLLKEKSVIYQISSTIKSLDKMSVKKLKTNEENNTDYILDNLLILKKQDIPIIKYECNNRVYLGIPMWQIKIFIINDSSFEINNTQVQCDISPFPTIQNCQILLKRIKPENNSYSFLIDKIEPQSIKTITFDFNQINTSYNLSINFFVNKLLCFSRNIEIPVK